MSGRLEGLVRRVVSPPRLASLGLHLLAVGIALAFAAAVLTGILAAYAISPGVILDVVGRFALTPEGWVAMVNKATTYYLAGLAAAIGFRMYLFNIGIDGQYRLGVFAAAVVGAAVSLPMVLQIPLLITVSCLVAGAYAAVAAYLKASRGVSEVISTIMLNAVATGIVAFLVAPERLGTRDEGSNNTQTPLMSESGWMPSIPVPGLGEIYGFTVLAVLLGVGFWVLTERTRFGFEQTAAGQAPRAALLGGTDPRRMIVLTMVVSGLIAGLVGLPELLGSATHRYGIGFPAGLAWVGLSIAIVGRNHPVGVALAALLWTFLERCALPLDLIGVPKEVVSVVQATVVLAVVTSYQLVHGISTRAARRRAASYARPAAAEAVS
ncbi:ABC transporter permease [Nocardioides sp. cx-173]|uniref:ABC transporter permease n=1 Tax=Nocardioides sp. cx-173 TaxID=2898796 RepID=UPI001E30C0A1|nr:ABC transporter permease [Nocardioides sp. cx-173]MCD4524044.1 ABC transporter permease [Nocardioides sp. cx-173]UGB41445.1 ABC transporter permease [Nocardioides sp. cx-173]